MHVYIIAEVIAEGGLFMIVSFCKVKHSKTSFFRSINFKTQRVSRGVYDMENGLWLDNDLW